MYEPDYMLMNENHLARQVKEARKLEKDLERIKVEMTTTLKYLECEEHSFKSTGEWLQASSDVCTKCGYEFWY